MLAPTSSAKSTVFQHFLPISLPEPLEQPVRSSRPGNPGGRSDPNKFSFGLLTALCPPEVVDSVIDGLGRREQRKRLLPARLVVYALLMMCIYSELAYPKLMHRLGRLAKLSENWLAPDKSAFSRARQRLGWEVMEGLFLALAAPLADATRDHVAFWHGLRVVAIDGTTLELPAKPRLERAFGGQRQGDLGGERAGPPRVRLLTLVECGTRALLDVAFGPYELGENSLARRLRAIGPGMLVLADRGFASKPLWEAYTAAGADLLWRAKSSVAGKVVRRLPDGSYLARFGTAPALTVRVIEYRISGQRELYRLLTNLLEADPLELAQLYHERWECETLTREIKIQQGQHGRLRSQSELGVRQEIWAACIVHLLNRKLAYQAALELPGRDPDRVSFSLVQEVIRSAVGRVSALNRRSLRRLLDRAARELSAARNLITRRLRSCPRVRYRRQTKYPDREPLQQPSSSPRQPVLITLSRA